MSTCIAMAHAMARAKLAFFNSHVGTYELWPGAIAQLLMLKKIQI